MLPQNNMKNRRDKYIIRFVADSSQKMTDLAVFTEFSWRVHLRADMYIMFSDRTNVKFELTNLTV